MHSDTDKSRTTSAESSLANSFHNANATVDELTLALDNFSRVSSPESSILLSCCCGREDCENIKGWTKYKSRLERQMILSAEVGQALLQKHEAYVRKHEGYKRSRFASHNEGEDDNETPTPDIVELVRENALLEKRLNQALINSEVGEESNKTLLHELQEARSTISRLTAHHARSVGWEARIATLIQEKDDIQQERDGESNRAKLAESRFAAMKDKTAKLQSEVKRLQDALEGHRNHHIESSEHVLRDARTRLEALHDSQVGKTALVELMELINVLKSLVNDNEALKRDNTELQNMLTDSREEIHALQGEVEEHRITSPSRNGVGIPHYRQHTYTSSIPSSLGKDSSIYYLNSRSASMERRSHRSSEPLTPETNLPLPSPTNSSAPSEAKWTTFDQSQPRYSSSHISIDIDDSYVSHDEIFPSPDKPETLKTLSLLTHSRAVQTDDWLGLSTSPLPSHISPSDHRSEFSSLSDPLSSGLSILLERVSTLFHRMTQSDALTLTNRLKRQHLKGADVGHLSRTTVNNVISEVTGLRIQHRYLLEDDSVVMPCTRKDFRLLFKLLKEIFAELGEMRVVLNDIILDPSLAPKISELALHPNRAETERREKEREGTSNNSASSGWMAPISKLFIPNGSSMERSSLAHSADNRTHRFVPKLGPALSASATTVNVEFSGTAVGRSTTSTVAQTKQSSMEAINDPSPEGPNTSSGVMNIFAGAPRSSSHDPWVVVSKGPRRVQPSGRPTAAHPTETVRMPTNVRRSHRSSELEATLDLIIPIHEEETDTLGPLLERTLRRRVLSDSSIHSTFASQAIDEPQPSVTINAPWSDNISSLLDRHSVLQTFTRTVQSFRTTASSSTSEPEAPATGVAILSEQKGQPKEHSLPIGSNHVLIPAPAGLRNLLPTLPSWVAARNILDPVTGGNTVLGGTRNDSSVPPTRRTGETHRHDLF